MLACGGALGRGCDGADGGSHGLTRVGLWLGGVGRCTCDANLVAASITVDWLYCRSTDAGPVHIVGRVSSYGICFSVSSQQHQEWHQLMHDSSQVYEMTNESQNKCIIVDQRDCYT